MTVDNFGTAAGAHSTAAISLSPLTLTDQLLSISSLNRGALDSLRETPRDVVKSLKGTGH